MCLVLVERLLGRRLVVRLGLLCCSVWRLSVQLSSVEQRAWRTLGWLEGLVLARVL